MLRKYLRVIALVMAVLTLVSLTGCGQIVKPTGTTGPDSTSQAGTQPIETNPFAETTVSTTDPSETTTPPETTEPSGTTPSDTTAPTETTAPETTPTETTVPGTTPPETNPPETTPPETTPPATTPPETTPPATTPPETTPPATTEPPKTTGTESEVLSNSDAAIPNITTAVASGKKVKSNDVASIDYSNTQDGYVMVRYTADTNKRLKVRVKGPETTYTYNLTPKEWAAFPLSDENGNYTITVYRNVEGNSYASVLSLKITVTMEDEFAPFIRSNQYVNFDIAPRTVSKAASLTKGMTDPLKKVEAIYNFVVNNMKYDKELAANVTSGYLPNLDSVLSKMSGICFDYAALMTGMLRSQGVPTKLVIGYAGDVYHAWINVYSKSTGWVDGVIYFDGARWKRMDPTFAANGGSGIMDYIGNGTNYSAKYYY